MVTHILLSIIVLLDLSVFDPLLLILEEFRVIFTLIYWTNQQDIEMLGFLGWFMFANNSHHMFLSLINQYFNSQYQFFKLKAKNSFCLHLILLHSALVSKISTFLLINQIFQLISWIMLSMVKNRWKTHQIAHLDSKTALKYH